jgi:hypothetical protein
MGFASNPDLIFEDIQLCGPVRLDSTPRFWNIIYGEYKKAVALEEAIILTKEKRDFITQEERYRIQNKLMPEFSTVRHSSQYQSAIHVCVISVRSLSIVAGWCADARQSHS